MAGYHGYSKSNNAVAAEHEGKYPLSKWTKDMIVSALENLEAFDEQEQQVINALISKPATFLKKAVLKSYEWHHTSSFYNCTDYYEVSVSDFNTADDVEAAYKQFQSEKKSKKEVKTEEPKKYLCTFLIWSGSRKHPRAEAITESGYIVGNWFMSSYGKKSIKANGFQIVRKLQE